MPNKNKTYGYEVRQPYAGEYEYFSKNPLVSGMATEDNRIILNPLSKLSLKEQDAVARNEAARLWLRINSIKPTFNITPEQKKYFKGTPYENDELALRHTILGRAISGDPSIGQLTDEQKQWSDWLKVQLESRRK